MSKLSPNPLAKADHDGPPPTAKDLAAETPRREVSPAESKSDAPVVRGRNPLARGELPREGS